MRYMDSGRRRLEGEHPGCVAHKPPRCSAVVVARSGASLPREGRRTGAVVVVAVGRARRRAGKRGEEGGRRRTVTLTGCRRGSRPEERREEGGGRRKEEGGDAHRLVHAAVVVLRGAHRSREKLRCRRGIAHRQGHTLRRCGRLGYGGGAVVPASGTAECSSEVAAGPEMETVSGAGSALVASMGI